MRNWILPGSEPRFNNLKTKPKTEAETGWNQAAPLAYLMLFAPLSCHYFKLPHDWAYIVPQVNNLSLFQRQFLRRNTTTLSNWPFHNEVSGLEDAALRYITRGVGGMGALTVVMGSATYYKQQKTRKNLIRELGEAGNSASVFVRYDLFNRAFPVAKTIRARNAVSTDDSATTGSHFVSLPSSRERITANLLSGEPWYRELAYIPFWQRDRVADERKRSTKSISQERLWFGKIRDEGMQLMSIASEDRMWDDPRERDLLDAFKRAFQRLLNREQDGLKRGNRDLTERWNNTMDRWHRRLLNAKTKLLLSATVHELLALASRSPDYNFRDNELVKPGGPAFLLWKKGESDEDRRSRNERFHAEFRRMMNHPTEWKKVRDLALLALTTFADKRLSKTQDQEATIEPQEDQE